ncbi:MAG: iron ABC transporter permease [Ilumatobacteraceae bacterium]
MPDTASTQRDPFLVSGKGFAALIVLLVGVLVLSVLIGISFGTVTLPLGTVWRVVVSHLGLGDRVRTGGDDQIIWQFRTPRVLVAAVVGASLSVAGAVLQVLARNSLADPYVLGVSSGASLGAVLAIAIGSASLGGLGVSGAAFAGAVVTMVLVFALAQRSGRLGPSRLVLAGVAVSYLTTAVTSLLQLQINPLELRGTMFWMLGNLAGADWGDLRIPTIVMLASLVWLIVRAKALNVMTTGDDIATTLGVNVQRFRVELLLLSSLLTATAVSVAGGIGFVGLVVPHTARLLVGPDHRRTLPLCALGGASFMILVDLISRIFDRPNEYPVGIFTAVLGAPFFLVLMRRATRGAT